MEPRHQDPHAPANATRGLEGAAAEVLRRIRALGRPHTVVGVTGPVGSGKSTLARMIAGSTAHLATATPNACVLPTDAYLPDYATIPELERDLPEHADLDLLARNLNELRAHRRTHVPVWSFHTHKRESLKELVLESDLIVVEGIHALDARIIHAIDIRVLVDAPPDVRWARWEQIETSGQRGWGVNLARDHFQRVAEPTFHSRIDHIRRVADLIVWNT